MKLVERILAGIDFGHSTEAVLDVVAALSERLRSEVVLAHVVPDLHTFSSSEGPDDVDTVMELATSKGTERLAEYSAQLEQSGIAVGDPAVLRGTPFDRILAHADDLDSNVILAGACSSNSDRPTRLGITAERLCRKSSRPVWLVDPESRGIPSSILCPVDFSKPSARAFRNAVFLARTFETRLNVLSVVPPFPPLSGWLGQEREQERNAQSEARQREFESFLGQFDLHGVCCNKLVRHGPPDQEILAAAKDTQADLVVMGSVGRTGLSRILLGSVAERVLQSMPCSMLLVKGEDAFRLQVSDQVADIETHFQHGTELLNNGFTEQASRQFRHCVSANVMFAPGWEALADCYERLGDSTQADDCRAQAKQVRDTLSWRMVEADIRSKHPLWRRSR